MAGPRPDADLTSGEFGYCAILDADLTVERVPPPGTPFWMEVAEFALSFDGYQYRGPELGRWANSQVDRYHEKGRLDDHTGLPDLRALLFYEQRWIRHLDETPTGEAARYVDALLAAIRSCVESRG
jgi:hypothetical protein